MCTVTIIPTDRGVRLACNRDELRTRSIARDVVVRRYGSHSAIMPVDPDSDGTWLAVSDAGLVMCLLNVNQPGPPNETPLKLPGRSRLQSRGLIIPSLLAAESLTQAIGLGCRIPPETFRPFRLVLADRREIAELLIGGDALMIGKRQRLRRPMLFTSSGLGDHHVQRPRRELFETLFHSDRRWDDAQDKFHQHCWPERQALSVLMSRPEASTVSRTVVTLDADSAEITYALIENGESRAGTTHSLELRRALAA